MEAYIPLFVGAMFTVVGGFFAFTGVRTRRSWKRFMLSAVTTQAQVLDLRYRSSRSNTSGRSGYYVPLLRFALPDDRIVEAQTSYGTNPPPAQPGDVVPVRYDPANPTRVELATGLGQGGTISTFFVIFGVGFLVLGLAIIAGYVAFVTLVDFP